MNRRVREAPTEDLLSLPDGLVLRAFTWKERETRGFTLTSRNRAKPLFPTSWASTKGS